MIEIIPKESSKISGWLIFLFYFSLTLLLVFAISYFRLNSSIKKNQEVLNGLNNDLLALRSSENIALEKEILNYEKKINDFKSLIENHKFNSRVFKFLEGLIHPGVRFNSFGFQTAESKIAVSGTAKSFDSLGQQIMILQKEQQVKDPVLESISVNDDGNLEFNISFALDPKILK